MALLPAAQCLADDANGASASYLAGLDAMSAGHWAQALAAFTKATAADQNNADYSTARGAALVMSQQFPDAIKELQRSLKLREGDWETKMWLSLAYQMNDDPSKAAQFMMYGPPGVSGRDKAILDYSVFVSTMARHYWQASNGTYMDPISRKSMTAADVAAAEFPRAGALFVQRRHGSAPVVLAGAAVGRIKANIQAGQYAAALRDLDPLLASMPDDDTLLLLHADAAGGLGDHSGSRAEYTRVLTDQPALAAAYLGRAQAAAHLADGNRAASDLALARKLGAKDVDTIQKEVDAVLAGIKVQSPADAAAQFAKAATEDPAGAKLADLALAVVQAVNARRFRFDEIYQDRLRALDEAVRAEPNNPDHLADMADFLFHESYVPFEQVEPGAMPVYYRYVQPGAAKVGPASDISSILVPRRVAREVTRASKLLETALAADPNHVHSLGVKGAILNSQGENGFARDTLDKGLAAKSDDPTLLRERSVAQQAIARADMLAAGALRDLKISKVDNGNGTETVTTVYPSQADLAKAAQFEAEAKACGKKAVDDMASAMKLTAGTAINAYWQGLTDYAYHDAKQAKADYEQAVKLDPKFRVAWEELGRVDWELNLPQKWAAARVGAIGPIQTTAAPWLTVARNEISRGQSKTARDALAAAKQLDPADARAYAYQGVVEANENQPDAAIAQYRMAIALEEAKASLHGRSLVKAGSLPLDLRDIGLTAVLRNRAGAILFQQGQADAASALFQANVTLLSTLPPEKLSAAISRADLPSAAPATTVVPVVETCAGLKFRAQAGLDYAAWARRYHEPADLALAAQTYKRLIVDFNVTDSKPAVLQAVISLSLAELQVSKGNFAEAKVLLRNEGATPQPLWQEMRKVEAQIHEGLR